MRSSGVICEFNPFHGGHAYLLSRMREQVGDGGCVVCVMSGRFVQRGEVAMADPYLRAAMALAGGADLVAELPFPWSAGSAEQFALGGVRILTRLGVDTLPCSPTPRRRWIPPASAMPTHPSAAAVWARRRPTPRLCGAP